MVIVVVVIVVVVIVVVVIVVVVVSSQKANTRVQNFALYEGWNFNSGNYLFTTDTK